MPQEKELLEAAKTGDLNKVKLALKADADINTKTQEVGEWMPSHFSNFPNGEWTPLHLAAAHGHLEITKFLIKTLLKKELSLEARANHGGWTPLHLAAHEAQLSIVNCLLENGANSNAFEQYPRLDIKDRGENVGYTPAELARAHGSIVKSNGTKYILIPDLTPDLIADGHAKTANFIDQKAGLIQQFWQAVNTQNTSKISELISQGIDINKLRKAHRLETALHYATTNKLETLLVFLLENGAKVDAKDWLGCTPLMEAAWTGNLRLAKLLIEHGANVGLKNDSGHTAVVWARLGNHSGIENFLIEIDSKQRSIHQLNLLLFAIKFKLRTEESYGLRLWISKEVETLPAVKNLLALDVCYPVIMEPPPVDGRSQFFLKAPFALPLALWIEQNQHDSSFYQALLNMEFNFQLPMLGTEEHQSIGNFAYKHFCNTQENDPQFALLPTQLTPSKYLSHSNEPKLSFGDVVGLAGDFFGVAEKPITETANTSERKSRFKKAFKSLFNRKGLATANKLLYIAKHYPHQHQDISFSLVCWDWKALSANNLFPTQYLALAVNNIDHFAPHSIEAYKVAHELAVEMAIKAFKATDPDKKKHLLKRALQIEAFGAHYLTDSFAAGHIRVPRKELWLLGKSNPLNSTVLNYLAKLQHDEDGKNGLMVRDVHEQWLTYGDEQLLKPARGKTGNPYKRKAFEKVCYATQVSIEDVWNSFKQGKRVCKAYDFLPMLVEHEYNQRPMIKVENGALKLRHDLSDPLCEEYDLLDNSLNVIISTGGKILMDRVASLSISVFLSPAAVKLQSFVTELGHAISPKKNSANRHGFFSQDNSHASSSNSSSQGVIDSQVSTSSSTHHENKSNYITGCTFS